MTDIIEKRISWSAILALAIAIAGWIYSLAVTSTNVTELNRRVMQIEAQEREEANHQDLPRRVDALDRRVGELDTNGTRGVVRLEAKLEAVLDRLSTIERTLKGHAILDEKGTDR